MNAIARDDMNPNQIHSYLFIHIIHNIYLTNMYSVMYARSLAQVVIGSPTYSSAIKMGMLLDVYEH